MWKISCDLSSDHSVAFLVWYPTNVFLMKEVETLAFGDDYLLVENDMNDSKSTSSPVLWRRAMAADAHGVVLEVGFPKPKSSTFVKYYSFHLSFWPAFTTWPISKEINSSGQHYWIAVWVISYPIHRSNHEWFLCRSTQQYFHRLPSKKYFNTVHHLLGQFHQSDWRLGSRLSGNPIPSQLVPSASRTVLPNIRGDLSLRQ